MVLLAVLPGGQVVATPREALQDAENRMKKTVEALERELAGIRTGRASPALVDRVKVEYYGVPTPLSQLASITAPEARLLIITPWERSLLPQIEKAVLKSELGLTPSSDGHVLRLPIPPLTEERRRDLTKMVGRRVEEGRIAIRNIRRDTLEELRRKEKEKAISQDEGKRAQVELQKLTDTFLEQLNAVGQSKEKEILEG